MNSAPLFSVFKIFFYPASENTEKQNTDITYAWGKIMPKIFGLCKVNRYSRKYTLSEPHCNELHREYE